MSKPQYILYGLAKTNVRFVFPFSGLFFDKHLKFIKLNENPVDFLSLNLSYLLQSTYDDQYVKKVYNLPVVSASDVRSDNLQVEGIYCCCLLIELSKLLKVWIFISPGPVRIAYHTKDAFKSAVKLLGLMDDFKSGVPRGGYRGIVSFFYNGRRVYLAPNANWKGYDLTWTWSIRKLSITFSKTQNNNSYKSHNVKRFKKKHEFLIFNPVLCCMKL